MSGQQSNGNYEYASMLGKSRVGFSSSPRSRRRGAEISNVHVKSGKIFIVQGTAGRTVLKCRLHMKIFKSDYQHHAYIYTDEECTFTFGFINLRKCSVELDEISKRLDISDIKDSGNFCSDTNGGLSFEVASLTDAREWLEYLTPFNCWRQLWSHQYFVVMPHTGWHLGGPYLIV